MSNPTASFGRGLPLAPSRRENESAAAALQRLHLLQTGAPVTPATATPGVIPVLRQSAAAIPTPFTVPSGFDSTITRSNLTPSSIVAALVSDEDEDDGADYPVPVPSHAALLAEAHARAAQDPSVAAQSPSFTQARTADPTPDLSSDQLFPSLGGASASGPGSAPYVPSTDGAPIQWGASAPTPPSPQAMSALFPASIPSATAHSGTITTTLRVPVHPGLRGGRLADIIKSIRHRTLTEIEASGDGRGTYTFLIRGPIAGVDAAKSQITSVVKSAPPPLARSASSTSTAAATGDYDGQTLILSIPASAVRFAVGTGGRILKGIQEETGARIHIPGKGEEGGSGEEVDVRISGGDVEGARRAILRVVEERTGKLPVRIRVDPQYLPFVYGAQSVIESVTGAKLHVPTVGKGGAVGVTGEDAAVANAARRLQGLLAEVSAPGGIVTLRLFLPRPHLKSLRLLPPHTLLAETGCTIDLSPEAEEEGVVVRGPASRAERALAVLVSRASRIRVATTPASAIHASAVPPAHIPRSLRHLHASGQIGQTLRATQERVDPGFSASASGYPPLRVLHEAGEVVVVGGRRTETTEAALTAVSTLLRSIHPAALSTLPLPAAPVRARVCSLLRASSGARLTALGKANHVRITLDLPEEADEEEAKEAGTEGDELILVYTGSSPAAAPASAPKKGKKKGGAAQAPSSSAASGHAEASQALAKTVRALRDIFDSCSAYTTLSLPLVPAGSKVEGGAQAVWAEASEAVSAAIAKEEDVQARVIDGGKILEVTGPASSISATLERHLRAALTAALARVSDRSHVAEVPVPRAGGVLGRVVGRGGTGLAKLREKYEVSLTVEGGNASSSEVGIIRCVGEAAAVEKASTSIARLVEMLSNPVEEPTALTIPARFHATLIGPGGRYVRRLEERYGVDVHFPRPGKESSSPQDPDTVTISGGAKGVEGAAAELRELLAYEVANGHRDLITAVPHPILRHVVGKGGAVIKRIRDATGTHINILDRDTPRSGPKAGAEDQGVDIEIEGSAEGVREAVKAIRAIILDQENVITLRITDIPLRLHRSLIGPGGSILRSIVEDCGGTEVDAGMVRFPRPSRKAPSTTAASNDGDEEGQEEGSNDQEEDQATTDQEEADHSNEIIIRGDKDLVTKVAQALRDAAKAEADKVSDTVDLPASDRPLLIGRGGSTLRALQERWSVSVRVPRGGVEAPVRILGSAEGVRGAKEEIASMVRHTRSLSLPRPLHRAGIRAFVRRFRSDLGVFIEDDANANEQEAATSTTPSDTVTWTLRGPKEGVNEAFGLVEEWLASGGEEGAGGADEGVERVGGELEVPTHLHRMIIGKAGRTIGRIMDESGCRVTVPPRGQEGETVRIVGPSAEAVEQAIALIEDVLDGAGEDDE